MNVLVTGACGLLGAHLMTAFGRRHTVLGVDRHPWWGDQPATLLQGDLCDARVIDTAVKQVRPDLLLHCAGWVNVEACERDPKGAFAANTEMTRDIVRAVGRACRVVYVTTDGIFTGTSAFATEEQSPAPRTVYGQSKLLGEQVVMEVNSNHLIIRTNFYGWSSGRKPTFAEWLYHALEQGSPITLFNDFFFSPIYVVDFVERLEALVNGGHRGIFHLCGKDRLSKGAFGRRLAEAAGFSLRHVQWGTLKDAPLIAPRPRDMSLDSGKFCRTTGLDVPGCTEGVQRFLRDRGHPLSQQFSPTPPQAPTRASAQTAISASAQPWDAS